MCPNSVPVLVTTSALCPTQVSCRPPFDVSHAVMPTTLYSIIKPSFLVRTKSLSNHIQLKQICMVPITHHNCLLAQNLPITCKYFLAIILYLIHNQSHHLAMLSKKINKTKSYM